MMIHDQERFINDLSGFDMIDFVMNQIHVMSNLEPSYLDS